MATNDFKNRPVLQTCKYRPVKLFIALGTGVGVTLQTTLHDLAPLQGARAKVRQILTWYFSMKNISVCALFGITGKPFLCTFRITLPFLNYLET